MSVICHSECVDWISHFVRNDKFGYVCHSERSEESLTAFKMAKNEML